MKHLFLLLLILTACLVPEFKPPQEPTTEPEQIAQPPQEPYKQLTASEAVKTVATGTDHYGYDEQNRLVYFESPSAKWTLSYDNDNLLHISGPKEINFEYADGRLARIKNAQEIPLFYDEKGRLKEMQAEESVHFTYDSKNHLRQVRRGVAGQTSIDYDKQNRTEFITRGSVQTTIRYDEKNRPRLFDHGDSHISLGYWRDSKLMKLSGSTLGEGIEVTYGPEPTPTTAQIIAAQDATQFIAPDKETLYKSVDLYLYCKYIRRIAVIFDGISYTIVREYFNESIQDYIIKNEMCTIYET